MYTKFFDGYNPVLSGYRKILESSRTEELLVRKILTYKSITLLQDTRSLSYRQLQELKYNKFMRNNITTNLYLCEIGFFV